MVFFSAWFHSSCCCPNYRKWCHYCTLFCYPYRAITRLIPDDSLRYNLIAVSAYRSTHALLTGSESSFLFCCLVLFISYLGLRSCHTHEFYDQSTNVVFRNCMIVFVTIWDGLCGAHTDKGASLWPITLSRALGFEVNEYDIALIPTHSPLMMF